MVGHIRQGKTQLYGCVGAWMFYKKGEWYSRARVNDLIISVRLQ